MLLPFFQWMEACALSVAFQSSIWLTPMVQIIHLFALTIFAGSILIVDVRLLGAALTQVPLAKVARDAQPWLIGSLFVLLISGIPQLTSTAMKQYYSPFFWWKMECLLIGLAFTFTLRRKITLAENPSLRTVWPKVTGVVSIAIWTTVATGARLIGLLS